METQRQDIKAIPQVLRLSKVAKEFNIGLQTVVNFLSKEVHHIEMNPNAKITADMYDMLVKEFSTEKIVKEESSRLRISSTKNKTIAINYYKPIVKENKSLSEKSLIKEIQ